ncbi:MAG: hypothetical protein ACREYC_25160 [Gammaproteobacteria bacterium]
MNDPAIQKVVTGWLAAEAYKRLRGERWSDTRLPQGDSVEARHLGALATSGATRTG